MKILIVVLGILFMVGVYIYYFWKVYPKVRTKKEGYWTLLWVPWSYGGFQRKWTPTDEHGKPKGDSDV